LGKKYEAITPELQAWIEQQRIFFVATAPMSDEGHVNCSPKGMDTFRVIGPREVAYLDLTGSGIETVAHLRENGRMVIMFCAFAGPPKIVRLHGRGTAITAGAEFDLLRVRFPDFAGVRCVIRVALSDISDSCGYAVPRFEYQGQRDTLLRWAEAKGENALNHYRAAKNAESWDGLPGLFAS
jgi:hypothetical protein